jgi:predicted metal-binding membrane protein
MVNMASRRAAAPMIVLAATLGLAAACWAAAAWLMDGMDMGVATRPGSFGFFAAAWVTMMAAMMRPCAAPAVAKHARLSGKVPAAPLFAGSYLAIWALAGVVAFALDRPHGSLAAIDVPLALALIGLGLVIVIGPSLMPGLTPPTM